MPSLPTENRVIGKKIDKTLQSYVWVIVCSKSRCVFYVLRWYREAVCYNRFTYAMNVCTCTAYYNIYSINLFYCLKYLNKFIYYIPINVLLKIHAVPSSWIQTSGSYFPYHQSVIFQIRIMPVWRVNFNNMPKICRPTFCTKED